MTDKIDEARAITWMGGMAVRRAPEMAAFPDGFAFPDFDEQCRPSNRLLAIPVGMSVSGLSVVALGVALHVPVIAFLGGYMFGASAVAWAISMHGALHK